MGVDTRNRLSSVERYVAPAPSRTYRSAYTTSSTSSYDYKVHDYANRLDQEEATREYMDNSRRESRYDNYLNSLSATRTQRAASPFRERYDYYAPQKYQRDYHYDTSDVGYNWKHYRLSNQTLTARNARAKSPIQSRSWTGTTRRSAGHLSSAMSHPDLTGTSDTTHTDQCPTLEDPTTTSLLLKAIKSCRSVWKIKITDQQLWVLCTLFKVILSIEYKLSVIVLFRP